MASNSNPDNTSSTSDSADSSEKGLARSSLVVSGFTLLSRVLGLLREIVFAALFGDGKEADAFFVAFKIPNFLRRLFAEGAFSQAFVPVLSEYRRQRSFAEVKLFIDHVAGRLGSILILVTVFGVLGAPLLASVFAFGYTDSPEKFSLLVNMLRITFPYILLISLTGFAGSILNSYGRFAVPAMTPIFLNISLIGCALLLSPLLPEPAMALAWGVLLAGLIQLMFQLPFLGHLKMIPRPRLRPRHEGVRKVILLMLPVMFSVSVGQINLMIDTMLATSIDGDGSVSWLYYADRLMEFPLGIFAIAIATVILPSLSRIHASEAVNEFRETLDWGMRSILLLGIPASVALAILAEPLVVTLFQRGAFSADSVSPTAAALQAYSVGLLGFMSIKILSSGYFSRQDTLTPVKFGVVGMISNIVVSLALIQSLAHIGLAIGTSVSALVQAVLLLAGLIRQGVFRFGKHWLLFLLQLLAANALMAWILLQTTASTENWLQWGSLQRIFELGSSCVIGLASYLLVLFVLGVRPAQFRH